MLADITSPQLPPITWGGATEAAPDRLLGTTGRITPARLPHTEATGRLSPELPAHRESVTTDRGTLCPSKTSQGSTK